MDLELSLKTLESHSISPILILLDLRPDAPILVSEFWPGWFDHWFEPHHNVLSEEDFR